MHFDPDSKSLPKRSELVDIPNAPKGAAWFWGKDDQLGRLNLLTPKRIIAASKQIRTGTMINLDLTATLPDPPIFHREGFKHTIKPVGDSVFDDLYDCSTQSGSQWDGFRHVGHTFEDSYIWYNNLSAEEIITTNRCGMDSWAKHGIAGRAVLIDYYSFVNESYDPLTTHPIPLTGILECAKAQNVQFQIGDILLIRSGFVSKYLQLNKEERQELGAKGLTDYCFAGVEQTEDMVDFLHDNYFAAVAGDAPAFESWPTDKDWYHHQYLLPLWGVPIGEMWDLEHLSEVCKKEGRYTFFFTSSPTNVPGGVGSFPNAMAIL